MADGFLDLSSGAGSVPPAPDVTAELQKKVDKPLGQVAGSVAIVDPTGNDITYRKFLANDIVVDVTNFKNVGGENKFGLNDTHNTVQKIVDKLEDYVDTVVEDPDSGETWVAGRKYPNRENFMVTPTQANPVDADGNKMESGKPYLMKYAGTAPMSIAGGSLTLTELKRMVIVAGAGGGVAEDVEYDDTTSKLAPVGTIKTVQKAIEALKLLADGRKEQEYVGTIADRDAIPTPKKGALCYVIDASADAEIGLGNGWANYIWTGTIWFREFSKKELKHIARLKATQFVDTDAEYDKEGIISAKQLDDWLNTKEHPQTGVTQLLTADASLAKANATFITVKPDADGHTLTVPAVDPLHNKARILVNDTAFEVKIAQTGIGLRGTIPPYSTSLLDDSNLNTLPTDNANAKHIHLTKTAVAPADADLPTMTEIGVAMGTERKVFGYYTGTDVATDTPKAVYHVDSRGHLINIMNDDSKSKLDIIFLTDAQVNPTIGANATVDEVKNYINTLAVKDRKERLFLYTGTATITDEPKVVFEADKDGDLILLDRNAVPSIPSKIEFAGDTILAPNSPQKPTNAEISVFCATNKHRETVITYTGTDAPTDTIKDIYYVDNYFNVVKISGSQEAYKYIFLSEAIVNPATAGKATLAEIKAKMIANGNKRTFFYYTGTATKTDPMIGVYHIDEEDTIIEVQKAPTKRVRLFLAKGTLAPADTEEPTTAEVLAMVGTQRNTIAFYTGTNADTDDVARVYDIDDDGNVTVIYKKPKVSDKRDIVLLTDVNLNPTRAGKAKVSEMKAYLNTLDPKMRKNKIFIYTGTADINDRTRLVFAGDADGDITKTESDILPEPTLFIKDSLVNPASSLKPTELEVQTYMLGVNARNVILRYTGTDVSTDPIARVYYIDNYANVTLLRKEDFVMNDVAMFLPKSTVNPVKPELPTTTEIQTVATTMGAKSRHLFYTGTDVSGDEVTQVYYADKAGKVTVVYNMALVIDKTERDRVFISQTTMGAVNDQEPTLTEAQNAINAGGIKNSIVYYTQTEDGADKPMWVYHADKAGVATLLYSRLMDSPFPNRTVHLKESVVAPATPALPTHSEINTAMIAHGGKDLMYTYNGTDAINDDPTGVYFRDINGDITTIKTPEQAKRLKLASMIVTDTDINPAFATRATLAEFNAYLDTIAVADRGNTIYRYTGGAITDAPKIVTFIDGVDTRALLINKDGDTTSHDYISAFDEFAGTTVPVSIGETFGDKIFETDTGKLWLRDPIRTYVPYDTSNLSDYALLEVRKTGNSYRWLNASKKFVKVKKMAEGLRGKPLADLPAIKAVEARDFEIRKDLSTGIVYQYEVGATPTANGFASTNPASPTGAWEIIEVLITETNIAGTAELNVDNYFVTTKYPLNHTSFFVPNADVKIKSTGTNKMFIYLNGELTPALRDLQEFQMLSTDIVYIASPSVGRINVFITRTVVKPPKALLYGGTHPTSNIVPRIEGGLRILAFGTRGVGSTLQMSQKGFVLPVGLYKIQATVGLNGANSVDYAEIMMVDSDRSWKLRDSPNVQVIGGNDYMHCHSDMFNHEVSAVQEINLIVRVTAKVTVAMWISKYFGGFNYDAVSSGMTIHQLAEETVIDASTKVAVPYTIKVTGDATTVNGGNATQSAFEDSGVVGVQVDVPTGKLLNKVIDQDGNTIPVNDARSGIVYISRTAGQGDITLTATLQDIPPTIGDLISFSANGTYDNENTTGAILTFAGDANARGLELSAGANEFTALVDMIIDVTLVDGVFTMNSGGYVYIEYSELAGKPAPFTEDSNDWRMLAMPNTGGRWKTHRWDWGNFKLLAGQKFKLRVYGANNSSGLDGGQFSLLTIKGIKI